MTHVPFSEVGSVTIQFVVTDKPLIPEELPKLPPESHEEKKERRTGHRNKVSIIEPKSGIIVRPFVSSLFDFGFLLLQAWSQERVMSEGRYYCVLRFRLVNNLDPEKSGEDRKLVTTHFDDTSFAYGVLRDLSHDHCWDVVGYRFAMSKEEHFRGKPWAWKMVFSNPSCLKGGLIPSYLVMKDLGSGFQQPCVVARGQHKE